MALATSVVFILILLLCQQYGAFNVFYLSKTSTRRTLHSVELKSSIDPIPSTTTSSCAESEDTNSESTFIVDKLTAVTTEEIADANIVKIVQLEATDQQCNDLVWKCLGYVYDKDKNIYDNSILFYTVHRIIFYK